MNVVIAAAGTGGHINPGIAIANEIVKNNPDSKVLFIGTKRGLETDLVTRAGFEIEGIDAYGIQRKITLDNIKRLYKTINSISKAKKILKEFKADIVIGTGGYICIPTILAAKSLKIKTVLHESNAFPGVAVKLLANKVDKVLLGFEDAKKRVKSTNTVVTGTPTKIKKLKISKDKKESILKELGLKLDKSIVLVFGGSQGAKSINDSVLEIIKQEKNKKEYQIVWAVGKDKFEEVNSNIREFEKTREENIKTYCVKEYIYNMEELMNICDLVICRSGAMTITELSIVAKPAIFIPFPFASENHQEFNAKVLKNAGAARIIKDKELSSDNLNENIQEILLDERNLKQMSLNASKIEVKNVEAKIYEEIKKVIAK